MGNKKRPMTAEENALCHRVGTAALCFLADFRQAAQRALQSARTGLAQTGHQKYRGDIRYQKDCIRCLNWLASHVPAWSERYAREIYHEPSTGMDSPPEPGAN